jgi:hypothetical protein
MVLCDHVHVDGTTQKQTILGTFSTVGSSEFPAKVSFAVYYAITDADGQIEITFRTVDSKHAFEDNSDPVFSVDIPIQSPSPLAVIEGRIYVRDMTLPEPGVYHCELLWGESTLMSRRLVALRPSDLQGDT